MVLFKKFLLRFFFSVEMVVFVWIYIASSTGLWKVKILKAENQLLAGELLLLEDELQKLEDDFKKWEHNPFFKEKWAREQLQMARETDEVYFLV